MGKLSIKRIWRLLKDEKPKAVARYLRGFLPPEQRKWAEVRLDEYANTLIKKYSKKSSMVKRVSKDEIKNKLKELMEEYKCSKKSIKAGK